jgi:hemerythrin-like domain-containing protein
MSDYDASELLVVCESILEDGELTYDELYRLADWLNSHHDACLHWPGNLLVEPLQKAGSDACKARYDTLEQS